MELIRRYRQFNDIQLRRDGAGNLQDRKGENREIASIKISCRHKPVVLAFYSPMIYKLLCTNLLQ